MRIPGLTAYTLFPVSSTRRDVPAFLVYQRDRLTETECHDNFYIPQSSGILANAWLPYRSSDAKQFTDDNTENIVMLADNE